VDYIDARLFKNHVLLPWLGTPVTIMNSPGNIASEPLEPSTPSKIGQPLEIARIDGRLG
jgi:hypothetical protein